MIDYNNFSFVKIKKSNHGRKFGGKKKRRTSYIELVVEYKKEMWFFSDDELHITMEKSVNSEKLDVSGIINLMFGQTVNPKPGDKILIKLEISSALADIGIIRKEENGQ